MYPWAGRISRPASSEPRMATAPAASTRAVTAAALAASMTVLRGTAARVVRIMPVAYSPETARTATMATTAWPRSVPVRLSLVMSGWQAAEDWQESGQAQGERGPGAQHRETSPRRQRVVPVLRHVCAADLGVGREGLLDGEGGGGGDAQQPFRGRAA